MSATATDDRFWSKVEGDDPLGCWCHICGGSGNEPDGTCGECAGTGVLDCACPYRCHIHH